MGSVFNGGFGPAPLMRYRAPAPGHPPFVECEHALAIFERAERRDNKENTIIRKRKRDALASGDNDNYKRK